METTDQIAKLREKLQNLRSENAEVLNQVREQEDVFLSPSERKDMADLAKKDAFEQVRNPDTDLVFSLRAKWYKPDSFEDDLGNRFTPKNCKGIVENAGRHQYWDFQSGFFSLNSQSKIVLEEQYTLLILVRWSKNDIDWRIPFRSQNGIDWIAVEPKSGEIGVRVNDTFFSVQGTQKAKICFKGWQLVVVTGSKMASGSKHSTFWMGTRKKRIRKVGVYQDAASGTQLRSIGHCCGKIRDVFIWNQLLQPQQILELWKGYFSKRNLHVNPWFPDRPPHQMQPPLEHEDSSMIIEDFDETETQAEVISDRKWSREDNQMTLPEESDIRLPDVRESLEHIVLYETSTHFLLIGSDAQETRFRVIKISRVSDDDSDALHLMEQPGVYSEMEMAGILGMVQGGNLTQGGLTKCVTAYGIVGFVKFVEGYYVVLVTERQKVGQIGPHIVYKIAKTATVSITSPAKQDKLTAKTLRNDEARYRNLFSFIDLTKEFYFSYTLDISRTLQENMCNHHSPEPRSIFIWNEFLMSELSSQVQCQLWKLPIIQGFFEQRVANVCGRELTLTLISRRSKMFAGTRYLKRGINNEGYSANDVETEQILHDRVGGDPLDGQFTSHVQMRASIPLFWSQESNAMVAKPDIVLKRFDPRYHGVRKHFLKVFERYGAPVLVLNLIRQEETKMRETILGRPFEEAVQYVNEFLPPEYKVDYHALDYKELQKAKEQNVVDELGRLAHWALQRTGFFHSSPTASAMANYQRDTSSITAKQIATQVKGKPFKDTREKQKRRFREPGVENARVFDIGVFQNGVVRSNCIDSLDRTNVAQFCTGKCALGYQLYAFGVLSEPYLDASSQITRVVLNMYERMGDCLALQYGGSQMHRQMKKDKVQSQTIAPVLYRQKEATTKPKEMLVSLMRHYQNSFQDNVKQDAMNLFLGVFRPSPTPQSEKLWTLVSDFYLHNSHPRLVFHEPLSLGRPWWKEAITNYRNTYIRCERKLKRLMEVSNENAIITYRKPKPQRLRFRRHIHRHFDNNFGSQVDLINFDQAITPHSYHRIFLTPNTSYVETEKRYEGPTRVRAADGAYRRQTSMFIQETRPRETTTVTRPPEYTPPEPRQSTQRQPTQKTPREKQYTQTPREMSADIQPQPTPRQQRRWFSGFVDAVNPFRIFRRNPDREQELNYYRKSGHGNQLISPAEQSKVDEQYVPHYGHPDIYTSKSLKGKYELALPRAVGADDLLERRKMQAAVDFSIDNFAVTEHECAKNFASTREMNRSYKDMKQFVGSSKKPNVRFQDGGEYLEGESDFYEQLTSAAKKPYDVAQPKVGGSAAEFYRGYFEQPKLLSEQSINPYNYAAYDDGKEPFYLLTSRERERLLNTPRQMKRVPDCMS